MNTMMRMTNGLCAGGAIALAAAAMTATTAHASVIQIQSDGENSTEGNSSFVGSIGYDASANAEPSQGVLTISLTNTNDEDTGGFITGFVFNINSDDPSSMAVLTSAVPSFLGVQNHPAPPFGMSFRAGAALNGDWSGGGNPNGGIAPGETGTFVFDIFATDAAFLNAYSFITGPYDFNFVVRFRGLNDGGSDKVPGTNGSTVPAPAALACFAFAGLLGRSRRRLQCP
jgi:hypothetical protein